MPGMYAEGDYDLAGTIVGAVDRPKLLDGSKVAEGDLLIGLPSSWPAHERVLSRAGRFSSKVWECSPHTEVPELGSTVAEALLAVHRSYLKPVLPLVENLLLSAMAHITGGGFPDNLPRVLPPDLDVVVHPDAWSWPPLFRFLMDKGRIPPAEMLRVFNCGIGMVLIVPGREGPRREAPARRGGRGLEADRPRSEGLAAGPVRLSADASAPAGPRPRPLVPLPARLAVLLSGRGSNFDALAEACQRGELPARRSRSSSPTCRTPPGLVRARDARDCPSPRSSRARWAARPRSRREAPATPRRGARRPRLSRGIHAHPVARVRRALAAPDPERPPVASPVLPRPRRAGAGGSLRRRGSPGRRSTSSTPGRTPVRSWARRRCRLRENDAADSSRRASCPSSTRSTCRLCAPRARGRLEARRARDPCFPDRRAP